MQGEEIPVGMKLTTMSVSAVIIRKDGTREDLGVISAYHSNPIKNAIAQLGIWIRGKYRLWRIKMV